MDLAARWKTGRKHFCHWRMPPRHRGHQTKMQAQPPGKTDAGERPPAQPSFLKHAPGSPPQGQRCHHPEVIAPSSCNCHPNGSRLESAKPVPSPRSSPKQPTWREGEPQPVPAMEKRISSNLDFPRETPKPWPSALIYSLWE